MPVSLEIDGAHLIFVGGGRAIERKISQVLQLMPQDIEASMVPSITIVAPQILIAIKNTLLADQRMTGNYNLIERGFKPDDLDQLLGPDVYQLVWAMTSDSSLNQSIGQLCRHKGIWCNASGNRSFRQGAVLNQAGFLLNVQSLDGEHRLDGARPAAAGALRDKIKEFLCTCPL